MGIICIFFFFFFQAEDGIRDLTVTGVQTCALPIYWCAFGSDNKIYALEVCDSVEADNLGYFIDGVLVSDFVTPAWFEPTCADRLDFKQHLSKELELARAGLTSMFQLENSARKVTPNSAQ